MLPELPHVRLESHCISLIFCLFNGVVGSSHCSQIAPNGMIRGYIIGKDVEENSREFEVLSKNLSWGKKKKVKLSL
jgi:hypothetical protein